MRAAFCLLFLASCNRSTEAARAALASPDPVEREKAAKALRTVYERSRSSVGDHGEAHWNERLEKARGHTTTEALAILGATKLSGGEAGGGGESITVRLDDFWSATLGRSTRGDDVVFATGKARRDVAHVDVERPASFTGSWSTYYVHGATYDTVDLRGGITERARRFHESGRVRTDIRYVDGKIDGSFATRSPEGALEREETWSMGRQVSERSYYPSGRVDVETTYGRGAVESQRHFLESGSLASCTIFEKGVPEPCP